MREVVAAHVALGVTDGPTHTELRLRGGDRPYLLELGARVGGSGVSHFIVQHTTGVDYAAEALRLAAGLPPSPAAMGVEPSEACGVAANYIVPCGGSGVVTAIQGLDELAGDRRVDHVVRMLHPGDVVRPYPDFTAYPAFVLSHHASAQDAEEFHQFLKRHIRVEYASDG